MLERLGCYTYFDIQGEATNPTCQYGAPTLQTQLPATPPAIHMCACPFVRPFIRPSTPSSPGKPTTPLLPFQFPAPYRHQGPLALTLVLVAAAFRPELPVLSPWTPFLPSASATAFLMIALLLVRSEGLSTTIRRI
ncbi:hypothetical protein Vafri_15717 [Volvox africanus]|nr:hypothetical protein Vafri_15717 [Volvox africanus]